MTATAQRSPPPPAAGARTEDDPRWPRILARDASADGAFWYSVLTTGVYCRPSCPSRAANPANVRLHDTLEAARATGFRPCLRCHPEGASPRAAWVAQVCRRLEGDGPTPTLAELSRAVGLSTAHLQRSFKAAVGLSPRAYADAARAGRLRDRLGRDRPERDRPERDRLGGEGTVTAALYAAGFASSSRFYDRCEATLGMTPTRYRDGGAGETLRVGVAKSDLGQVLVAMSAKGVAAILIGDDAQMLARDLRRRFPKAVLEDGDAGFAADVARVVAFVQAPLTPLELPLDIRGTAFQARVWAALREIPPGRTASYGDIAHAIGAPSAMRAVAGACAANPLAVAVPCHRVVRGDGSLSGYRWGVERKRRLLQIESAPAAAR